MKRNENQHTLTHNDSTLEFGIIGALNEDSDLPNLEPVRSSTISNIEIDLSQLTSMNSYGIRGWLKWIDEVNREFPKANIAVSGCPTFFISQASVFVNLLPQRSIIRSFYVCYFDESTDEEIQTIHTPSKTHFKSLQEVLGEIPVEKNGLKLDHIPESFFRFLVKT